MTTIPDNTLIEDGKPSNDLESAKFTKDKETVDVVQPTAKLIGLTKEQLEQYRNDPFWKAVRYSLFIAFWLVWLVMFIGAILIVVMSPKCVEVKWPDKMVAYKIFTLGFEDKQSNLKGGDFSFVKEKLATIKEMGMNAIWPTPLLNLERNGFGPETVVDLNVAEQLGGQEKFKELVKSAHTKDVKVIVDIPLTVSKSADNWVHKADIKDGTSSDDKDTDKATKLNLKNPDVQKALVELAKRFIEWGVDGLNLADYNLHAAKEDVNALAQQIREIAGAEQIPLYSFESGIQLENVYDVNALVGDEKKSLESLMEKLHQNIALAAKTERANDQNQTANAPSTHKSTIYRLGSIDPGRNRLDKLIADTDLTREQKQRVSMLFSLVQMFIPGPNIVLYGEELGLLSGIESKDDKKPNLVIYPWDNSTKETFLAIPENADTANYANQLADQKSLFHVFSKVAKIHQHHAFLLGEISQKKAGDVDAYLVKQYPDGNKYYCLIVNWSGKAKELASAQIPEVKGRKLTSLAATDAEINAEQIGRLAENGGKVTVPGYGAFAFQIE